ncbi:D-2-hydroxyacid dehydrogenase [Streptomyces sp. NBC_01537]|uniref:D-2-hydroxyacid dehydrogenase n=1 Tax=Streptomyces sp. NBC_01537 TaxID=2903896 RepID=UPI00386A7507
MTYRLKLVCLHDGSRIPDAARVAVEELADVRWVTEEELAPALSGADALYVGGAAFHGVPAAWPQDPALAPRWVHVAATGVEHVLCDALVRDPGVILTNSQGIYDQPIAEYVLGLVLALAKDLPGTLGHQERRAWRWRETERIGGRTALVVGTGPIGRAVARLLRAVGMGVVGVGRADRADDPDFGTVHGPSDRTAAFAQADYVVLVAPLTPDTRGMVDARLLAAMKPTARLINVGRGALVVQDDLIEALRAGRLAGAALDVFEDEPLPASSPLWHLPGVIVSPHMAGDVHGWREAQAELFLDNLRRHLAGRPLRNVVDKRRGYVVTGITTETGEAEVSVY